MSTRTALEPSRVVLAGMAADLYGGGDARPPLVLLHGLAYSRRTWRPVLDELSRLDSGRRVLVPDLPGQGESPSQLPHSFDHLLEVLHQAVTEAALPAPVVVGHSHGGGLAAMYAGRYPCRGAVSVDSAPADVPAFAHLVKQFEPLLRTATSRACGHSSRPACAWTSCRRPCAASSRKPVRRSRISSSATGASSSSGRRPTSPRCSTASWARWPPVASPWSSSSATHRRRHFATFSPAFVEVTIEDWSPSSHFPHLAHPTRFAGLLASHG